MDQCPLAKRSRVEPNLFDEARRINAADLLNLTMDDAGNLEARICMVFPRLRNMRRLILEMNEHGDKYRFLVFLAPKVLDILGSFPLRPGDMVCLSLKGAQIEQRTDSSSSFYLPIVLTFNEGIAFMHMSAHDSGKVFNTWEGEFYAITRL